MLILFYFLFFRREFRKLRIQMIDDISLPECLFMITYRPRRVLASMCTASSATKTGPVFARYRWPVFPQEPCSNQPSLSPNGTFANCDKAVEGEISRHKRASLQNFNGFKFVPLSK
jgi:hypothetical protein